jgi:hypothetical protein
VVSEYVFASYLAEGELTRDPNIHQQGIARLFLRENMSTLGSSGVHVLPRLIQVDHTDFRSWEMTEDRAKPYLGSSLAWQILPASTYLW